MKAWVALDDLLNELRSTLRRASFVQLLVFSCACVERWLPYVGLISSESEKLCRNGIAQCWQMIEHPDAVEVLSSYVHRLDTLAEQVAVEQEIYKGLSSQVYEDVVVATLCTVEYAVKRQNELVGVGTDRIRDAAYQLAQDLLGTRTYPSNTRLPLYEMEINQQYKDLQTIMFEPHIQGIVNTMRSESNRIGLDIQQKIIEFWEKGFENPTNRQDVVELWLEALNDPLQLIRFEAAQRLYERKSPLSVLPMVKVLEETKDEHLKVVLAAIFGEWKESQAVAQLIALLSNGTIRQQEVAAESLGKIGDKIASPTLIVMLRNQPSSVARHAAVALGKINDPQSVEPLKLLLQDSDEQVRYFANLALIEMNKNNL